MTGTYTLVDVVEVPEGYTLDDLPSDSVAEYRLENPQGEVIATSEDYKPFPKGWLEEISSELDSQGDELTIFLEQRNWEFRTETETE